MGPMYHVGIGYIYNKFNSDFLYRCISSDYKADVNEVVGSRTSKIKAKTKGCYLLLRTGIFILSFQFDFLIIKLL